MLTSIRNVKFIKMRLFTMFIPAVCVLVLNILYVYFRKILSQL